MTNFNATRNSPDYLMTVNNLSVGFNAPPALASTVQNNLEMPHALPPYQPRRAHLVDNYADAPASWLRSSGRIKSYFVAVQEGTGMWLDFNRTIQNVPNDVAIVVSVQGVNAVTGLKTKDAALEQYLDRCPRHDLEFSADRLCTKCGYKWPRQNYLASAVTPCGMLWLDGFRTASDGVVRQYVFTRETARGVAAAIIGEERVFAIGISFYLSKNLRPVPAAAPARSWNNPYPQQILYGSDVTSLKKCGTLICSKTLSDSDFLSDTTTSQDEPIMCLFNDHLNAETGINPVKTAESRSVHTYSAFAGSSPVIADSTCRLSACNTSAMASATQFAAKPARRFASAQSVKVRHMEVAAGACINQRIYDDTNPLSFYADAMEGMIVINYCSEAECEAILAGDKLDVSGSPEGFLKDIPVGHQTA